MYYCNPSESKKYLLDTFTFKPQEFKHQDLVDQLENISLLTEEPSSSKAAKKWISLVSFSFLFFTHSMLNIRKWKKYIEMLPKKCKKTLFAPERRQWKPKMNLNLFHKLINSLLTTMSTRLNWSYWSSPFCLVLCDQNSFGWSKMISVWPNWFGLDHNDLVTTKMKWSRPKWIG